MVRVRLQDAFCVRYPLPEIKFKLTEMGPLTSYSWSIIAGGTRVSARPDRKRVGRRSLRSCFRVSNCGEDEEEEVDVHISAMMLAREK